jgi:hypothetical protein
MRDSVLIQRVGQRSCTLLTNAAQVKTRLRLLGIGTGNPGVLQGYPYPYLSKTCTLHQGYGSLRVGVRVLYGLVRVCRYENPMGPITGSMYCSTLRQLRMKKKWYGLRLYSYNLLGRAVIASQPARSSGSSPLTSSPSAAKISPSLTNPRWLQGSDTHQSTCGWYGELTVDMG